MKTHDVIPIRPDGSLPRLLSRCLLTRDIRSEQIFQSQRLRWNHGCRLATVSATRHCSNFSIIGASGTGAGTGAGEVMSASNRLSKSSTGSGIDFGIDAAVASSQPLESTITSKTCRYCSQLVVPPNPGTLVVVNAACRGCIPQAAPRRSQQPIFGSDIRQVLLHPSDCVN